MTNRIVRNCLFAPGSILLIPQALTSLGSVMASRHARQSPRRLARPSSPQFRRVIGGFFRNWGSGVVEGPAAGLCGSSSPFPSSRCAPSRQRPNSAGWTSIIVPLILNEIPASISALGFLDRLTRFLPIGQTDQLLCPQVSSKCGFENTKFGISGVIDRQWASWASFLSAPRTRPDDFKALGRRLAEGDPGG